MDGQAAGELIRRSLGLASPAPLFEERLFRETDGNPLFILETLRILLEEGLLTRNEDHTWAMQWDETTADYAELPLSPVVEKVIVSRLERLPAPLRRPLEIMAVLGNQFDFEAFLALSGQAAPTALEIARELICRSFLKETANGYRFEHDKIHQAAYEQIEAAERLRLHQAAAYFLETRSAEVDALAWHFWHGQAWEQAARYNWEAARSAMWLYANHEARLYLDRALTALIQLPPDARPLPHADILWAHEAVNNWLGDRPAQKADLDELDRILDAPVERAALTLRQATYHEATSNYPSAIESARQAVKLAGEVERTDLAIAARLVWARVLTLQAQIEAARRLLAEALDLARACGDRFQEARCPYLIATAYYEQSRFEETLDYSQRALQIFQSLGDQENEANCLSTIAGALTDIGKVQTGIEHMENVLRIRRALGDRRGEAQAQYSLAIKHHFAGDDDIALHYCREVTASAQAIGDLRLEAYGRTYLGLLLETSDPQQAYQHYARALEIRQQIGQPAMQVDSRAGLARALLEMGRVNEAAAYITEALTWVDENGTDCVGDMWLVYLTGYRVFTIAGKDDDAARCIETANRYLVEELDSMPDEATRTALLESLPELRQVQDAYREFQRRKQGIQRLFCLPPTDRTAGWVHVTWTLNAPEDEAIPGKVARRRHRLMRLLEEAKQQGAAPSYRDLAEALGVGLRTVERDMASLKE